MKASELIKALTILQKKMGNVDVVFDSPEFTHFHDVKYIEGSIGAEKDEAPIIKLSD